MDPATAAMAGRWSDPYAIDAITHKLRMWIRAIEGLLDPRPQAHLTAPCPACGERMVWRDAAGELVQVPALQVDVRDGCVCLACGHRWHGESGMAVLAAVIDAAPPPPRARLRSSTDGNGGWTAHPTDPQPTHQIGARTDGP